MKAVGKEIFLVWVLIAGLIGCAGGNSASETKPLEQIQKEVQSMDVSQLEATVKKYEEAIKVKAAELEKVSAKLKEIPIKEMLGEEAKAIKAEIEEVTKSANALKERLAVYADALKMQMQKAAQ